MTCRICEAPANQKDFMAREMMFGTRDEFRYCECSRCGCVQIAEIPRDLARYYPREYYSLQVPGRLRLFMKAQWLSQPLRGKNLLKRILSFLPGYNPLPEWLLKAKIKKSASVLEIGCGVGEKLLEMRALGFKNLVGIDPYIERELHYKNGVVVLNREISSIPGPYNVVMLHHSLEHIPDQHAILREVNRLLSPAGVAVVRIPVASSHAWKRYGTDWVQFDAPRHLYLHTRESMDFLARACGFEIGDVLFDSTEFQFWGSEQYVRGIPLRDERSYAVNRRKSIFTRSQMREFRRRAEELNRAGAGDSMAFYLHKNLPR